MPNQYRPEKGLVCQYWYNFSINNHTDTSE